MDPGIRDRDSGFMRAREGPVFSGAEVVFLLPCSKSSSIRCYTPLYGVEGHPVDTAQERGSSIEAELGVQGPGVAGAFPTP